MEIQHLPKGWTIKELETFVIREKGKYTPKNTENIPCIELEHLNQETGSINGFVNSGLQASTKNVFNKGQVLFGKLRPYLKKYWYAEFDGVCSSEIWVLDADKNYCTNNYLFCIVQSFEFIQACGVTSGSKMPRADWSYICQYPIKLPPLHEQQKIAQILSTWDESIQTTQKLIKKLEIRKRGLMQNVLSSNSKNWKTYQIAELIKQVKRPVKWNDNELYNLISVRRRSGGAFFRESLPGHQILTKDLYTAKKGDFLISKMQISHGASGLVGEDLDNMKVSGSYIAVVAKNQDWLDMNFFDWYSRQRSFYHLCYTSSYGVHIEKMTFDFNTFLKRTITIPPIEEQTAIVKILNTADAELNETMAYLEILKQQKKGLIQQLLTGKIRVK